MTITAQYNPAPLIAQELPSRDVPVHIFKQQFTAIVNNWTPHLQYTAWQITRNKQVSEDIVQEAFLALWLQRVKVIPEKPVGWLIRVVTNLSVRYIRDKNMQDRIYRTVGETVSNSFTEVEELLIVKEKHSRIKDVFDQLPDQQKIVLHLSKEKGMRRDEIAACMQLSPNTVKVHLNRAVQFMKENLPWISVFALLFICNNIFFKKGNTNEGFMESFTKRYLSSITVSERIENRELPKQNTLLKEIVQVTIQSIKQ